MAAMTATDHAEPPICDPTIPPELSNHPRYRVLNQLGAGGMGMVYRAEHVMMGRTVAVKVMAQKYTANRTAVERFRREVRAAAKLAHPNIVTAYDADEANGRHFLVMEYVEGVSLDRVVNRRGPLPVTTACHVVRLVALGLQHAHSKGMVHRDIKPQNVMVNKKGLVKVLDFGLARLATDAELPQDETPNATQPENIAVTGTNMVLGTPDYLSPEQAKSTRDVDHRSDIYSLGCLFYFALAGRPPFAHAKSAFDKVIAHTTEQPQPVTQFRDDVPDEVASILLRMLAKDPAERFATAQEVAAALLPFTKGTSVAAMNTSGLVAIPILEAIPLADFEIVEDTPSMESQTEIETPPPVRRPKRTKKKPAGNWKRYAKYGAIAAGALIVIAVLGNRKDDAPKEPGKESAAVAGVERKPLTAAAPGAARILFLLPKRNLMLDDYLQSRERFVELGAKVTTAARTRGPCGFVGLANAPRPEAELEFSEVRPEDFDAVVVPGLQVNEFIDDGVRREVERIVNTMRRAGKVIGGIGLGQIPLMNLDAMNGRTAANIDFPGKEDRQRPWQDRLAGVKRDPFRGVVSDDKLVTASGARDAKAFADAVLAAIRQ
jgi:serine/threonine protein kinase/putative intracellular protease/amidase